MTLKFCLCLLFVFALVSCTKVEVKRTPQPVPVTADKVVLKQIPIQIITYGNIEPYSTVPIKSLVAGTIVKVEVKSGQDVKKGDLLFSIDSRAYDNTLEQYKANLERDSVLSADSERQFKLKDDLYKAHTVSEDEMLRTKALSESLKRTVKIDLANIEKAKLDIEYCSIRSPLDGRAGDILIDDGTIVKANEQTLIIINQIKPVDVSFAVPQFYLNLVKKHIAAGKLDIKVKEPNEDEAPAKADFEFLDNQVDKESGTVRIEGKISNDDERFWPGQFVNVTINLITENPVLVVPSQAVQPSQKGNYVYVLTDKGTVEMRVVQILRTVGLETALKDGVSDGETVITDGHMKLVPGAKVEILKSETSPSPVSSDVNSKDKAVK